MWPSHDPFMQAAEAAHLGGDQARALGWLESCLADRPCSTYPKLLAAKCHLLSRYAARPGDTPRIDDLAGQPISNRLQAIYAPVRLAGPGPGAPVGTLSLVGLARLLSPLLRDGLIEEEVAPCVRDRPEARLALAQALLDRAEESPALDGADAALKVLVEPGPHAREAMRWRVLRVRALLQLDLPERAGELLEGVDMGRADLAVPLALLELRHAQACDELSRATAAAVSLAQLLSELAAETALDDQAEAHVRLARFWRRSDAAAPAERHADAAGRLVEATVALAGVTQTEGSANSVNTLNRQLAQPDGFGWLG